MEATEINEFGEQMKESGEAGLQWVSLAISVLAVLVALVTVLGHRTHTEAILMQSRAADQWNEYQSKKIRQGQMSLAEDLLSVQPAANSRALKQKLAQYSSHIQKWNSDLAEEQEKATELEAEVRHAERRAACYDLGEGLLQIAVVLSSITLLTRQRFYVLFGLALGIAGIIASASAAWVR